MWRIGEKPIRRWTSIVIGSKRPQRRSPIDVTLTGEVANRWGRPVRPGYLLFGADRSLEFAWLPRGTRRRGDCLVFHRRRAARKRQGIGLPRPQLGQCRFGESGAPTGTGRRGRAGPYSVIASYIISAKQLRVRADFRSSCLGPRRCRPSVTTPTRSPSNAKGYTPITIDRAKPGLQQPTRYTIYQDGAKPIRGVIQPAPHDLSA